MNVNVSLIFTTINWNTGEFFTVSTEPDKWKPPTAPLISGQPADLARELFALSVNLHANWADIKMEDAVFTETGGTDDLNLIYSCSAPLDSNWKQQLIGVTSVDMQHDFYVQLTSALRKNIG
jgi:hypothetical protein